MVDPPMVKITKKENKRAKTFRKCRSKSQNFDTSKTKYAIKAKFFVSCPSKCFSQMEMTRQLDF